MISKNLIYFLVFCLTNQVTQAAIHQMPVITLTATKVIAEPSDYQDCPFRDEWECQFLAVKEIGASLHQTSSVKAELEDPQDDACKTTSNPIDIASGTKTQKEVDFTTEGEMPLELIRYYNSAPLSTAQFGDTKFQPVKWQHNFDYFLTRDEKDNYVRILPDGTKEYLGNLGKVVAKGKTYTVYLPDGGIEIYNNMGRILSKTNKHGIGWTVKYSVSSIRRVTHTNGKYIEFVSKELNSPSLIVKVIDPAGNIYNYQSDNNGILTNVIYPDGSKRTYHYGENNADPSYLTGISINGRRFSSYTYLGTKAVQSGRSDGTQLDKVSYGDYYSIFTNPLGAISKYTYADSNKSSLVKIERSGVNNCPNASALTTYDANKLISSKTDFNGNVQKYLRDTYGRVIQEIFESKNGKNLVVKYTWKNAPSLITKIEYFDATNLTTPLKTKELIYNSSHNRIQSEKVCSAGICRTTGYGYSFHSNGMLSAVAINKNSKTTTYSYDSFGNLLNIKNPLGHTINYSNYNSLGLVGKVTYPNGLIEEYSYDALGRVNSIQKKVENNQVQTTSYQYGSFGPTQIETNGVRESIYYNDNGTISQITHGNRTQVLSSKNYTYSALGQLLSVSLKEGNSIRYSRSNQHNQLGWMTADIGNSGQNEKYDYDAAGNIIKKIDSLGKTTSYIYGSQGNLYKENRSDGSSLEYSYDAFQRLMSVKDARGNLTTYNYDGFDNLISVNSPDAGLTTYQYDLDGNPIQLKRSNNAITSYSYDALNRRIKAQSGNEIQTWVYDNCTNGYGLLCATADGITSTGYGYNKDGQLTAQVKNINGVRYSNDWSYDAAGNLIGESFQNGSNKIIYTYDALNRINAVKFQMGTATQPIVSNITYEPYGDIKGFTYGNGLLKQANYDKDYRIIALSVQGIQNKNYSYNSNNWITQISNTLESQKTTTYSYDALGQLSKANSGQYNESWLNDSNYNRINRIGNTNATTSYVLGSGNRLTHTTGADAKTFTYDVLGNITRKSGYGGQIGYSYDGFNRLKTINTGPIVTYDYDVFNLRSRKSGNGGTINYVYAPDGRLLAESPLSTSQNGSLSKIYIWLAGEPVAVVTNNQVYYIHNDHLSRPEIITNANKAIVWKSQSSSYDSAVIQSSIGEFNLGFPGQYYDAESTLWYNWNRYYDATTGRYTQSDPIGLAGGLNTYTYVENNPISYIDKNGLNKQYWEDVKNYYPDVLGATNDFFRNYKDMRNANTIGADKYFHCKANCQASKRGAGGRLQSRLISEAREQFDHRIKGDSQKSCDADRKANDHGRDIGFKSIEQCNQVCEIFRPNGLNQRY